MIGEQRLGPLTGEITEFTVPAGEHVFNVKLGPYSSIASKWRIADGEVLDLTVVENPDAVAPMVQGEWVKLVPSEPSRVHSRLHELAEAARLRELIKAENQARARTRAQARRAAGGAGGQGADDVLTSAAG